MRESASTASMGSRTSPTSRAPIGGWQRDFGMFPFPQTLADLAAQAGSAPILIGGDFNATIDMEPFRDLLTATATRPNKAAPGAHVSRQRPDPVFHGHRHIPDPIDQSADVFAMVGSQIADFLPPILELCQRN